MSPQQALSYVVSKAYFVWLIVKEYRIPIFKGDMRGLESFRPLKRKQAVHAGHAPLDQFTGSVFAGVHTPNRLVV